MSTSQQRTSQTPHQSAKRRDPIVMPLAILLWILVLAALAYGVVSTLQKVPALFG